MADSTRATVFTCFPQLPSELQRMIWRHALPRPRFVTVISVMNDGHHQNNYDGLVSFTYKGEFVQTMRCTTQGNKFSSKTISHLLQTCRESRAIVLSRYQPLFGPKHEDISFQLDYFDPLRDRIFVERIWPWGTWSQSVPTGIRNARVLVIDCNAWWAMWQDEGQREWMQSRSGLRVFRQLRNLDIIFDLLDPIEKINYEAAKSGLDDVHLAGLNLNVQETHIQHILTGIKKADPSWKVPELYHQTECGTATLAILKTRSQYHGCTIAHRTMFAAWIPNGLKTVDSTALRAIPPHGQSDMFRGTKQSKPAQGVPEAVPQPLKQRTAPALRSSRAALC
ncbi:hypothetical protein F5884DRAFT_522956 [Xylogone sp. PMI_703]|nr:hypothetical protein F5884DRAFT_522956 [Xylogone sp. PMI_703]